jgi:hypothetical protein
MLPYGPHLATLLMLFVLSNPRCSQQVHDGTKSASSAA